MESKEIKNLITLMAKIPGLGPRSARRSVLNLIKNPEKLMLPLAKALIQVSENKAHQDRDINIKKKQESLSLVKEKINSHVKQNTINTNSDYLLARMEKVNFFRNYFYNKKLN